MTQAQEMVQRAIIDSACEWLLESPAHVREYLAAELTWALIGNGMTNERIGVDLDNTAVDSTIVLLESANQ